MRKPIAVASVSAVLLILWFTRGVYVGAQGGGKGECIIGKLGDVNGDGVANVADPVYLLNWLFLSGPEPCACAQACDTCLTPEQAQMLDDIAFGRKIAGTYAQEGMDMAGHVITRGLFTLGADGTASYDNQEEFGYWPEAGLDHFASSFHGTWIRIGPREIRIRLTRINFLEDGTPLCVPEIFPVGTFSDDSFRVISGLWSFAVCAWDTWSAETCDPLNGGLGGKWRGTRIPTMP